jgi:hypothetical protein
MHAQDSAPVSMRVVMASGTEVNIIRLPADTPKPEWLPFLHRMAALGRGDRYSDSKRLVWFDMTAPAAASWMEKWAFLKDAVALTLIYRE